MELEYSPFTLLDVELDAAVNLSNTTSEEALRSLLLEALDVDHQSALKTR